MDTRSKIRYNIFFSNYKNYSKNHLTGVRVKLNGYEIEHVDREKITATKDGETVYFTVDDMPNLKSQFLINNEWV